MQSKIPIDLLRPAVKIRVIRNPVHRLILTCLLIVAIVLLPDPSLLTGAAAVLLAILLWRGLPFGLIAKRLLLILPFALGAVILLPFAVPGEKMFDLFGFSASVNGFSQSLTIFLKVVCVNFILTYLVATTPLFDLIKSLRAVGIPAVMIEIISLMLRYFILLAEEMFSILKAQKARGFSTKGWFWSSRMYKRFGEMIGMLFLRAYHRSNRVYQSMSARGGFEFWPIQDGSGRSLSEVALDVQNISYAYKQVWALKDVSFTIKKGSKTALMGANGAGKSTLISLLNGFEQPTHGTIRVFGETIGMKNRDQVRLRVGVVYQDPDDQIFSPTIEEDIAFGPRNLGISGVELERRINRSLQSVGMDGFQKKSPFELSYGQKRRVAIAGVLAMEPEILILDEPMAFLDPRSKDELQALLEEMNQSGITILVTTHDVDFAAEWADQVIVLKRGSVLASGDPDLLFHESLIDQADLHLPRLARPFRLLAGMEKAKPKTVEDAAELIRGLHQINGGMNE